MKQLGKQITQWCISYENRREHRNQSCLAELEKELLEVFLNQPNHIKLISCFQESNNDQDCQPEEIKYTSLGRCGTRSRQHITNCRQSIDHSPACGISSQFPPPADHQLETDYLQPYAYSTVRLFHASTASTVGDRLYRTFIVMCLPRSTFMNPFLCCYQTTDYKCTTDQINWLSLTYLSVSTVHLIT